jgi:hypothetical protein
MIGKRQPEERTSKVDSLGLNAAQYTSEIHKPHLIPFRESFKDTPDHLSFAADGAGGISARKIASCKRIVDIQFCMATQLTRS